MYRKSHRRIRRQLINSLCSPFGAIHYKSNCVCKIITSSAAAPCGSSAETITNNVISAVDMLIRIELIFIICLFGFVLPVSLQLKCTMTQQNMNFYDVRTFAFPISPALILLPLVWFAQFSLHFAVVALATNHNTHCTFNTIDRLHAIYSGEIRQENGAQKRNEKSVFTRTHSLVSRKWDDESTQNICLKSRKHTLSAYTISNTPLIVDQSVVGVVYYYVCAYDE